jgi:hypothetical protein
LHPIWVHRINRSQFATSYKLKKWQKRTT